MYFCILSECDSKLATISDKIFCQKWERLPKLGISEIWYPRTRTVGGTRYPRPGIISLVGPETRDPKGGTQDSRPGTQLNTWDVGPNTRDPKDGTRDPTPGTLKVGFQKIFSDAWRLWMNSCALCVYDYFVCFALSIKHSAYTLLIFYHLDELLFPSFCKKVDHAAVMKSLNSQQNQW